MDSVGAWHCHGSGQGLGSSIGMNVAEWTWLGHGTVMAAAVDMATRLARVILARGCSLLITHLSDCYKRSTFLIIKGLYLRSESCGWFNLLLFPSLFCHCPHIIHSRSGILGQSIPSEQIHRLTYMADHLEPDVSNGVVESPKEPTATQQLCIGKPN